VSSSSVRLPGPRWCTRAGSPFPSLPADPGQRGCGTPILAASARMCEPAVPAEFLRERASERSVLEFTNIGECQHC